VRLEALTIFRFFAALIVVVFHYGGGTDLMRIGQVIVSGPQMVTFFFTLSGFVLLVSHYSKNNESVSGFYMARVARIFPIYLIATLVMFFLTLEKPSTSVTALVLNITFLQSWFPPFPLSINSPAWSLSVEAFFYLIFPLFIFFIKTSNTSTKNVLIASVSFYVFTQLILINLLNSSFYSGFTSASHQLIYYFPLSHFASFVLGVAGGVIYIRNSEKFCKKGWLGVVLLLVSLFMIYYVLQNQYKFMAYIDMKLPVSASLYSAMFLVLILVVAYSNNFLTKFLSYKLFVLLGESSYSLYILQVPVHILTSWFILDFGFNKNEGFSIYLLCLIAISIFSYLYIEKPSRSYILRVANPMRY